MGRADNILKGYVAKGHPLAPWASTHPLCCAASLPCLEMSPHPTRSGNQHLHHKSSDYRDQVRCKLVAYQRHIQLGCIVQGLLQYLSLYFRQSVWAAFKSWMRTMKTAQPPSEAVVAQALRVRKLGTLPISTGMDIAYELFNSSTACSSKGLSNSPLSAVSQ